MIDIQNFEKFPVNLGEESKSEGRREKGMNYHEAVSLGLTRESHRICQKTIFLRD